MFSQVLLTNKNNLQFPWTLVVDLLNCLWFLHLRFMNIHNMLNLNHIKGLCFSWQIKVLIIFALNKVSYNINFITINFGE